MVKHLVFKTYTGTSVCYSRTKPGNHTTKISETTCKRCLAMSARFPQYLAEGEIED